VAEPLLPNSLQARAITVHGGSLFAFMNTREEILTRAEAVLAGISEGWLVLRNNHIFPLEQVQDAQTMLEKRMSTGKVLLKISD
jgi:NADPH:quinone reductase